MIDRATATGLARAYLDHLERCRAASGEPTPMILLEEHTREQDFGWVFFYAASDPDVTLAGNAPVIVDRRDGSVHATGTAFPIEEYVASYARARRTEPFAIAEYAVHITGWTREISKVPLAAAIRAAAGMSLVEAKRCADAVFAGDQVTLVLPTEAKARTFQARAEELGVETEFELRYR